MVNKKPSKDKLFELVKKYCNVDNNKHCIYTNITSDGFNLNCVKENCVKMSRR